MNRATLFQAVGGTLSVIGLGWAAIGFHASDAPALLGLLAVGVALLMVGIKLKDRENR